MNEVTVHHGDSRVVLRDLPDNSVDSVCTDPPYALTSIVKRFGGDTAAPAAAGVYGRSSSGFMGQKWDTGETAFDPAFWVEVLRVLKPGGHVVAFSGTRTYHRLACAIEDAGFEIRDMVLDMLASDLPMLQFMRSLTDEQLRAFVRVIDDSQFGGMLAWIFGSGFPKSHNVAKAIDRRLGAQGDAVRRIRPGADQGKDGTWEKLEDREYQPHTYKPATPQARAANGQGTALKPAFEPVVLARKPLQGTVADNAMAYGVGALQIDQCRVAGSAHADGRWPANVIHDGSEEAVGAFPAEAGAFAPVRGTEPSNVVHVYGERTRVATQHHGDSGSAARFFYTAKADAEDRLGSKHPTVKPVDLMAYLVRLVTPRGGLVLDPFAGTGTTGLAAMREGCDCILIERETEYVGDIRRRLAWARGEGRLTAQEMARKPPETGPEPEDSLFAGLDL